MTSKALEVNIACSKVDVTVDSRYLVLEEVLQKYEGARKGLKGLLEEICHPYRNWSYIVKETRSYALNYFHITKTHERAPSALEIYIDIFFQALESSANEDVRKNAVDNLLLFIQKILKDSGPDLYRFLPVLQSAFNKIASYPQDTFAIFARSFYQLNKLGAIFAKTAGENSDFGSINKLLIKYYDYTYTYWLTQTDPMEWFERESGFDLAANGLGKIFEPITHAQLKDHLDELAEIRANYDIHSQEALEMMVSLPGYAQIVKAYNKVPGALEKSLVKDGQGRLLKLIFLLYIMNVEGLSSVHEDTLREINRTMGQLIATEELPVIYKYLEKTINILRTSSSRFPATALNCVKNMGEAVYKTDESDLVDLFIESVVSLGFQAPRIQGVGDDWQVKSNPHHIQNIRTWMELIELKPKWSKKLLSSLIVYLALTGVFIKDTDLFPRDISKFLNSDFSPVYNLAKQLMRLFPTYFNDIGAEGKLRDISTRIDEISLRKDPLIHFLRKQSHVESSNQIVGLMEGVFEFWRTKKKDFVTPYIPPNIFAQVEEEGLYIDGVHTLLNKLYQVEGIKSVGDLLYVDESRLRKRLGETAGVSSVDYDRLEMAVTLYKLLCQKYRVMFTEMESYLSQLQGTGLPDLSELQDALAETSKPKKLLRLLLYLEKLKQIILAPRGFEAREDIYRKRHFTVDIPSMYGSYHELKFDALGLTFRIEALVNVLFEDIVNELNLEFITRETISQIYEYLILFDRALRLDGIESLEVARQLDLLAHSLKIRGFSSTQFVDIFRGFALAVNNIVHDYFNNMHQNNLMKIIAQVPKEDLLPKYRSGEDEEPARFAHRVSEIFLRDRIASSLGLQQMDVFIGRILGTLYQQADQLPKAKVQKLLSYDPKKAVTPIYPVNANVADLIHLGNKGLNLVRLKSFGLPVPPGFIITTEVFRCREVVESYLPARKNLEEQVAAQVKKLEKLTGKQFGNPHSPLLLSVRSGSSISQPGMMSTFLDVGINREIVNGLVELTQNPWFAWDTYRRFLQSYGMAFGIQRDLFDAIISDFKNRLGLPLKREFSGEQMKQVALTYESLIRDHGVELELAPFRQLMVAVSKVFDSWNASKAVTYRRIMGISDDWGTAVTIQAMVFGNYSPESGSGVFFTHNPRWAGDMLILWGDFTVGNQGEDVVSGLVKTLPISVKQAEAENRDPSTSLEVKFPEIYRHLREWAKELIYERRWSPQEMEFTFEGPTAESLYFLQTRDMVMRERKKVYSFDLVQEGKVDFLGHGIGVSGGAMSGRAVFSLDEIRYWREKEPDTYLILVRGDTVPDDIKEIYEADGLLTARGGSTSHAAIVAHRLGKTCVVGCGNLICMEKERSCSLGGRMVRSGDWISIDGSEGSVYLGIMKIKEVERS
ncbi:MAG: pyruvate, phosphate dikinase [Deltaproteobacteria bacterium]|nr:MAG: pyruvate, phosphate dikinase [Deltaproteobacteria bacterium]